MKGFIRQWREFDLKDVQDHLIVVGELSSECYACHEVGLDKTARACPKCKAYFKYMGFRRKLQMSFLKKIKDETPSITLIDFEDLKKATGQNDARKILGL
jgi:hypothetical protein